MELVEHFLRDIEMNRLPQIARKTGRSIEQIKAAIEKHPAVEKLIRLRTRQIDLETHRVAADVEFDGAVLADKLEDKLRDAWEQIETYEDFKAFCDQYADDIVELLGDEIDVIEAAIVEADPKARYLDIETE